MALRAAAEVLIAAPATTVMAVLTEATRWPDWCSLYRAVEVLDTGADGLPRRVRVVASVIGIRDEQELEYIWQGTAGCSWTLLTGGQARSQIGSYRLSPQGAGTQVRFELEMELNIPLPGFLVRQAQKKIVSAATTELKAAAEARG